MTASIVYIWYLVVAGPGGGMAITPSAFDTREDCFAAIEEYRKGPADPGWSLQCIPTAASFFDEGMLEEIPAPETPASDQ